MTITPVDHILKLSVESLLIKRQTIKYVLAGLIEEKMVISEDLGLRIFGMALFV